MTKTKFAVVTPSGTTWFDRISDLIRCADETKAGDDWTIYKCQPVTDITDAIEIRDLRRDVKPQPDPPTPSNCCPHCGGVVSQPAGFPPDYCYCAAK